MGIGKLSQRQEPKRQERAAKEPDYRREFGECQAAVWEEVEGNQVYYSIKLSRVYVDGFGKRRYSDAFYPAHLDELSHLIGLVKADCDAATKEHNDRLQHSQEKPYPHGTETPRY